MTYLLLLFTIFTGITNTVVCEINTDSKKNVDNVDTYKDECNIKCSTEDFKMVCAFDADKNSYKLFANNCTMMAYGKCHNIGYFQTETHYCIKSQMLETRRMYGESCPVFCPSHYRPVCAASKMRSYIYKSFNNGCHLDMLNCRGEEDFAYVEVPLDFCQRHAMKNIFQTQVVVSGFSDYRDYHDY